MKQRNKRKSLSYDAPPEEPQVPRDWLDLMDTLELRNTDEKRWNRLPEATRRRAEKFEADRQSGVFGPAWMSLRERTQSIAT